jgi:hypothetical protein
VGNGGAIQVQASRPGAKHSGRSNPGFQAEDEMRRQELREQPYSENALSNVRRD